MKVTITLTIEEELKVWLEIQAEKERRSLSNMTEVFLYLAQLARSEENQRIIKQEEK